MILLLRSWTPTGDHVFWYWSRAWSLARRSNAQLASLLLLFKDSHLYAYFHQLYLVVRPSFALSIGERTRRDLRHMKGRVVELEEN